MEILPKISQLTCLPECVIYCTTLPSTLAWVVLHVLRSTCTMTHLLIKSHSVSTLGQGTHPAPPTTSSCHLASPQGKWLSQCLEHPDVWGTHIWRGPVFYFVPLQDPLRSPVQQILEVITVTPTILILVVLHLPSLFCLLPYLLLDNSLFVSQCIGTQVIQPGE